MNTLDFYVPKSEEIPPEDSYLIKDFRKFQYDLIPKLVIIKLFLKISENSIL